MCVTDGMLAGKDADKDGSFAGLAPMSSAFC
jgi:hypothetical protein